MTEETDEGAERRRHPRRELPRLVLRVEDHKYRTRDWSFGGFRIDRFHRPVDTGERLRGVVTTWTNLFREEFDADVVRSGEGGDVRCEFVELPRSLRDALEEAE